MKGNTVDVGDGILVTNRQLPCVLSHRPEHPCVGMGNLAYLYLNGISVRKNPVRAVALYEEAVKGPSPDLEQYLYDLANCYELGIGVPPDRARAMALYAKSAQLGSRLAQQALSRLTAMAVAA